MRENNLVLEEITKYSCSEVSTIKLGRIRNSVVENKIEFDTQTNRPVLLSRIVVVGHTEEQLVGHTRGTVEETEEPLEQVTTPWRIGEGDTMDNLCQKIFQLIPADRYEEYCQFFVENYVELIVPLQIALWHLSWT